MEYIENSLDWSLKYISLITSVYCYLYFKEEALHGARYQNCEISSPCVRDSGSRAELKRERSVNTVLGLNNENVVTL